MLRRDVLVFKYILKQDVLVFKLGWEQLTTVFLVPSIYLII